MAKDDDRVFPGDVAVRCIDCGNKCDMLVGDKLPEPPRCARHLLALPEYAGPEWEKVREWYGVPKTIVLEAEETADLLAILKGKP